jgi:hypothetical protein
MAAGEVTYERARDHIALASAVLFAAPVGALARIRSTDEIR